MAPSRASGIGGSGGGGGGVGGGVDPLTGELPGNAGASGGEDTLGAARRVEGMRLRDGKDEVAKHQRKGPAGKSCRGARQRAAHVADPPGAVV